MSGMKLRALPEIEEITDFDGRCWESVKSLQAKKNVFNFIPIMVSPWRTVIAPKGMPCYMTTMSREPLYQYKLYKGKVYDLQPEPSCGFPGS